MGNDKAYNENRRELLVSCTRGNAESLKEAYDKEFLPYERIRKEFFEGYRSLYEEIVRSTKNILGNEASSYAQSFLGLEDEDKV